MSTESRNLNFVGVLSVVEKQLYTSPTSPATLPPASAALSKDSSPTTTTDVETTVVFRSRLGERIRDRLGHVQQAQQQIQQQAQQHQQEGGGGGGGGGFFAKLGARGIQRSIEKVASTKTLDQLGKSREGMHIILERLRQSGIIGVLELRKRAREGRGLEAA